MALSYVAAAHATTSGGNNYTTMPIAIPTSRAVGDLMVVGVGSHSGSVGLPTGFTQLHSPSGGFKVGYQVSTSAGGGTATATSSGGAHGAAWMMLLRGYDPAVHEIAVDGVRYANPGSSWSLPALSEEGGSDSWQIWVSTHRFGTDMSVPSGTGATRRWWTATDWGSCLWTRTSTTAPGVVVDSASSGDETAGWNIYIYRPIRRRPVVGFIGFR